MCILLHIYGLEIKVFAYDLFWIIVVTIVDEIRSYGSFYQSW